MRRFPGGVEGIEHRGVDRIFVIRKLSGIRLRGRRDQLEGLLSRGYELAFKTAVLTRYDLVASRDTVELLHPREKRMGHLALVH